MPDSDQQAWAGGMALRENKGPALAMLIILFIIIIAALVYLETCSDQEEEKQGFSQGYITAPYYPDGLGTYGGGPYQLATPCTGAINIPTDDWRYEPYRHDREGFATAPGLVYAPPFTREPLTQNAPQWWPARGFDSGWTPLKGEADRTIHTIRTGETRPPLCEGTPGGAWRYYGGPYGWSFSPYW